MFRRMTRAQTKLIAFLVGMAIFVRSAVSVANGLESSDNVQLFSACAVFLCLVCCFGSEGYFVRWGETNGIKYLKSGHYRSSIILGPLPTNV